MTIDALRPALADPYRIQRELGAGGMVNQSGTVRLTTHPLLTPEEFDRAAKKTVGYRPPGA